MKTPRLLPVAALALALVGLLLPASAQTALPWRSEIPLYPGAAPGSEAWDWSERNVPVVSDRLPVMVQNVVRPTLLYFPADKAKAVGTAMIVAPGGGFTAVNLAFEGASTTKRLNEMGIDVFILKYRVVFTRLGQSMKLPPVEKIGIGVEGTAQAGQNVRMMAGADGQQAVRLVRQRAAEFGVRPDRVGMIGFSAGGYVTLAAVMGPVETRPNFAAPIYPATPKPGGPWTELAMTPPDGAPPLFLAVAADDELTGWQGTAELFTAWRKAGIPAELHIFQVGGHGFSKKQGGAVHFMDRLEEWLRLNGWLTKVGV